MIRHETHCECECECECELESFHSFFDQWLLEQNQHLEQLVCVSRQIEQHPKNENGQFAIQEDADDTILRPLVERVFKHYEHYYSAKSRWAKNHILSMFNPSWRSSLEDSFLWIGGWRPSVSFHLLYSISGLQLEARLAELISGLSTGDLGDLSATQLHQVNELQMKTMREERKIAEKHAKLQETVADASMVDLSHVLTEILREEEVVVEDGRVEAAIAPKKDGLVDVMQRADDLRLATLKQVIKILTPNQAVHFLIAAAELHLRIHEWGKRRDAQDS